LRTVSIDGITLLISCEKIKTLKPDLSQNAQRSQRNAKRFRFAGETTFKIMASRRGAGKIKGKDQNQKTRLAPRRKGAKKIESKIRGAVALKSAKGTGSDLRSLPQSGTNLWFTWRLGAMHGFCFSLGICPEIPICT
jgi:hypothetical protein